MTLRTGFSTKLHSYTYIPVQLLLNFHRDLDILDLNDLNKNIYSQFTLKCSAIGEPVPQIKITDELFEPDLQAAEKSGQLGLRTATKVFTAIPGITPSKVSVIRI